MKYDSSDLRNLGLKATAPRMRILALFQKAALTEKRHLTADEVFSLLREEGEDVGLATVYRVLTQFEVAGLLRRHHFDSESASYELGEPEHHDHLVCLQCGKIGHASAALMLRRIKDKSTRTDTLQTARNGNVF